jgi:adenosyl cobinamide kinase/adenosyl cobinamide phosphate guanylyltransferase
MLPIMIGIMILSTPIVKILFEQGSFNSHDTYLTSTALFYYSMGIVAVGIRDITSRAFYSLQDTKTPVKNAVIVSDFIYSDAARYDEVTETYRKCLADIDRKLAAVSDVVIEVAAGNMILHKGELPG